MKITLNNIATFHESPKTLETDKKVNLVYGLNGTGKTTISDFLYYHKEEKERFKDCKLEGVDNEKILVYNQSFVQDNFHNRDNLKEIFTLSKENKKAEEEIKKANNAVNKKQEEKSEKEKQKQRLENEKKERLENIKNTVWKIKTTYSDDGKVLGFCLEGLKGSKESLFEHIDKIQDSETKPGQTAEDLKEEALHIIGESVEEYGELPLVNINVGDIESHSIFSEVIVGKKDSPVADLIRNLGNSDWVKQGINYLPEIDSDTEQCPFCQQETITKKIAQDIKNYFDEIYEKKIEKIKEIRVQYGQVSLPVIDTYKAHPLMQKRKDRFENLYNELKYLLNKNRSKIAFKLREPSQKIELVTSTDKLKELNELIKEINNEIKNHNKQIHDKEKTQQAIKNIFWKIMRYEYNAQIITYHGEEKRICSKIKQLENNIKDIDSKIEEQRKGIVNQQKNMVNIEEAIKNINAGLYELGIEGFIIKKHEGNSYRIVRNGTNDGQYPTLSEGEKMIITFLYFMELCKGKESKEEEIKDKIVIIDDPVSSLSHTYIFNLSQWIKKYFFKGDYKHIIVLTHSLYFFHELIRGAQNKNIFRLTKSSSKGTQILGMDEDEIKNEYESYWQVIKDHDNSRSTNAFLAISMRNILEHFFGFINKENIDFLETLGEDKEFIYFKRYMNKNIHSDAVNITDFKEIDHGHFKEAFRKVFREAGYEEHYEKMMS